MHPKHLLVWTLILSVLVTLAGALIVPPTSAQAAQPVGIPERPVSPGTGYQYGVKMTDLTASEVFSTSGGWAPVRNFTTAGSATATSKPFRKTYFRVTEPYYVATGTPGLRFDAIENIFAETNSFNERSRYTIGQDGTSTTGSVMCATTPWSLNSAQVKRLPGATITEYGGTAPAASTLTGYKNAMTGNFIARSGCEYVVFMTLTVRTYVGTVATDTVIAWSAERFYSARVYGDQDGAQQYCATTAAQTDQFCIGIGEGVVDTRTEAMCNGAPTMAWLDFSWIPATVNHYAKCLFIPKGFDPEGRLLQAYGHESMVTLVKDQIPAMFDSFRFQQGGCGVLLDTNLPEVKGLRVDTCEWTFIPAPLHALIYGLTLVGFAWLSIGLLLRWNLGLIKSEFLINSRESA